MITTRKHLGHYVANFTAPYSGQEMYTWCRDHYGLPSHDLSDFSTDAARWWNGIAIGEILFRYEEDLTLFILRWAS